MEVKNILVPVDFSACSKNALKVAIDMAKKSGAKLHLLNAVHINAPHPELVGGGLMEGIIADYESQIKDSFDALEKEIVELKDVPHENDRFLSYLTDAIYAETEAKKIDLIVMGTRGNHDSIEHLTGTNASDVIELAPCPVLVIPEDYKNFNPTKIGFASDFNNIKDLKKLSAISYFAQTYDAEVLVFHVTDDFSKIQHTQQDLIGKIRGMIVARDVSVRTVEAESTIAGISDFIKKHELDLLSMMPRKHNLFVRLFRKSVTKSLAIDCEIPLLTFHES